MEVLAGQLDQDQDSSLSRKTFILLLVKEDSPLMFSLTTFGFPKTGLAGQR